MSKKVYIETQGCQMNEYDSSRMADLLGESHGMVRTDNPEEADVLLMNTCSIREKAQEKVFSELGRWRKLKEKRPEVVIGVGGCVASQEGELIRKRASYVDMVFGPQTLHRLPKMLDQRQQNKIALVDISFPDIEKFDFLPEPKVEGHKAFVSIMEGCSKYCSFCVVPYTVNLVIVAGLDVVGYICFLAFNYICVCYLCVEVALIEQIVLHVLSRTQNIGSVRNHGPLHCLGQKGIRFVVQLVETVIVTPQF